MADNTRMRSLEEAGKKTDYTLQQFITASQSAIKASQVANQEANNKLQTVIAAMEKSRRDHDDHRRQFAEIRSGMAELQKMMKTIMLKDQSMESLLPRPGESPLFSVPGEKSIEPFENPNKSESPVQLNQESILGDESIEVIEETSLEMDKDPKDFHLQTEPSKVIHCPLKIADVGVASKEMGESVEVEVSIEIEMVDFWNAYILFDEMFNRSISVADMTEMGTILSPWVPRNDQPFDRGRVGSCSQPSIFYIRMASICTKLNKYNSMSSTDIRGFDFSILDGVFFHHFTSTRKESILYPYDRGKEFRNCSWKVSCDPNAVQVYLILIFDPGGFEPYRVLGHCGNAPAESGVVEGMKLCRIFGDIVIFDLGRFVSTNVCIRVANDLRYIFDLGIPK